MADYIEKRAEILQSIVNRLAQNSFAVKGWAIAVVTGVMALSAKDSDRNFAILGIYPSLAFWAVDAYYLMKERQVREFTRRPIVSGEEFVFIFDADTLEDWASAFFSMAVWPIYFLALGVSVMVAFYA